MTYITGKTDKRFHAYPYFKYAISTFRNRGGFFILREWLWQTYGPSKELHEWTDDLNCSSYLQYGPITHHNEKWCWTCDSYSRRIFLLGDAELALFKLRFE